MAIGGACSSPHATNVKAMETQRTITKEILKHLFIYPPQPSNRLVFISQSNPLVLNIYYSIKHSYALSIKEFHYVKKLIAGTLARIFENSPAMILHSFGLF
jgi:hypothetical protein